MRKESAGRYVYVVVPGHPMADSRGRVLEHRYKMAKKLGRPLLRNEVVHHKNEKKRDNRIRNLQMMKSGRHSRIHHPPNLVRYECAHCMVEIVKTARTKTKFCSRKCMGLAFSITQMGISRQGVRKSSHGTRNEYQRGCRCSSCRESQRKYIYLYREMHRKNQKADTGL